MSLNNTLSLKIVRGEEIRKLHRLPQSWSDMQEVLRALYGNTQFQVTYQDEEGDLITISNDEELHEAYERSAGKPSLKLVLRGFELSESKNIQMIEKLDSLRESLRSDTSSVKLPETSQSPMDLEISNENKPEEPVKVEEKPEETKREVRFDIPNEPKKRPREKKERKEKKEKREKKEKKEKRKKFGLNDLIKFLSGQAPQQAEEPQNEGPAIHNRITCDGCQTTPIQGIRYKCSVCPDFDFCEKCEATAAHPHPFLKLKTPQGCPWRRFGCGRFGRWGGFNGQDAPQIPPPIANILTLVLKEIRRGLKQKPKKYKLKVIDHLYTKNQEVPAGGLVKVGWRIKNIGKKDWPEGTKLVYTKGSLEGIQEIDIPALPAGKKANIEVEFKAPLTEGKHKGIWKVQIKNKKLGKLASKINVVKVQPDDLEGLTTLMKMGFTLDQAKIGLEASRGDVNMAVSQIFKRA
ncbi:unnamed protein product [Blepharisma stoltei]|uniref:Sequestosome-1 n=1 Tax=Blepharisma stoltei TaxID=1481888 RepID=A0AAU9IVN6_9CILI|nr:unnamed protein product [Blepharisma stoltei]